MTSPQRINPIHERVDADVFTDREEILAKLWKWVEWAAKGGRSTALLAPRRMGKSVLLERLYNMMFWEQDMVVPFLFEMNDESRTIETLNRQYYTTFIKQYLAFKFRVPSLVSADIEESDELLEVAQEYGDKKIVDDVKRYIKYATKPELCWGYVREAPKRIGEPKKTHIAVMIDEFQELNRRVYVDEDCRNQGTNYGRMTWMTSSFKQVCEYYWVPMLVTGSSLSLMEYDVLGKLIGRFNVWTLPPMSDEAGAELGMKLAAKYGIETNIDTCIGIAQYCKGNPYYITRAFESEATPDKLLTLDDASKVFSYEVERGGIHRFWTQHFDENVDKINDQHLARRILLYLAENQQESVFYETIAEELDADQMEVNKRLKLFEQADLIQRDLAWGYFKGIIDPMLANHIKLTLRPVVRRIPSIQAVEQHVAEVAEDVKRIEQTLQQLEGALNYYLGRYSEIFIENVMYKFDNRIVDKAQFFAISGEIKLPKFEQVYRTRIQMASAPARQLDIFGWFAYDDKVCGWAVEAKNRPSSAFNKAEAEKFLSALEALKVERQLHSLQGWVVSTEGFTKEAGNILQDAGVLYSDINQLQELLRLFNVV